MVAALVAFTVSALLSAGFVSVPAMRRLLLRSPAGDRWRSDAVPVAGGLALGLGSVIAVAASLGDPTVRAVVIASGIALVWGLVDDVTAMPPLVKLAGQAGAGIALAAAGVRLPVGGGLLVEAAVTVAWVMVMTNAVNLLDNMDGVAAGVGAVAAGAVWWWWGSGDGGLATVLPAATVGALVGYLVFNVRPARLFMGDSGSLWLGATLAGLVAADGGRLGAGSSSGTLLVLAVPAALLAVPIFDMVLVVVERARHGRPISKGGQDHTAHRLVAVGMSPGVAAVLLWAVGALGAAVASALRLGTGWFTVAAVLLVAGLTTLALRVMRVDVY
jgi:UDP-GlcNAc:undecaprenyl-phosphate/decaprenyl-phosphate GlcNAc-1-phosphate transferase